MLTLKPLFSLLRRVRERGRRPNSEEREMRRGGGRGRGVTERETLRQIEEYRDEINARW